MDRLIDLVAEYQAQRAQYSSFSSFIPVIQAAYGVPLQQTADAILKDVHDFQGAAPQWDDRTLVLIRAVD